MRVADTSALYALFSEDDRFHKRALKDVSGPDPIVVPSEILVETIDLLAYRFGRSAGRKALDSLLQLPHVRVAEKVELSAVGEIHSRGKLSLADAFVVQTCVALGADVLAYDRRIVAELRKRRP
ncbi:MAG: type II toxin-antitoxin system VapC family toxin [Candidatus Thermoplasmatota archaeon]|nr:type II toxin-antitoxin system VapC family toxin [Candidatus Thermoplasmatota archaeon]